MAGVAGAVLALGATAATPAGKNSGTLLSISGNVTKGKDVVLVYNMQCRIM